MYFKNIIRAVGKHNPERIIKIQTRKNDLFLRFVNFPSKIACHVYPPHPIGKKMYKSIGTTVNKMKSKIPPRMSFKNNILFIYHIMRA